MKFEITNIDGTRWMYDNLTNRAVSLDTGLSLSQKLKELKLSQPLRSESCSFDMDDCSAIHKDKTISKLRIQLGLNCNYKCSFCLQRTLAHLVPTAKEADIDEFFKKLDRAGIVIKDDANIQLWGGEPLVYIKLLKILVPKLRKRYPNADISTISNGTLLTREIADFLIEYHVSLTFSHDAQAYFLRGKDPLSDPEMRALWRETIQRYRENNLRFGINTVISQYNADLFEIQNFFEDRLGSDVGFGFEGVVVAHTPNAHSFTLFGEPERRALQKSIYRALIAEPESKVGQALSKYAMWIFKSFAYEVPMMTIKSRCDVLNPNTLGVDLFGNIMSCHNVSAAQQCCGKLDDFDKAKYKFFTHWSRRKACSNCIALVSCKGNCPRDNNLEHSLSCDAQKMFHVMLFRCAWAMMTGSFIKEFNYIH